MGYALALSPGSKNLPRGIDSALEKEANVVKEYTSELRSMATAQLTASHALFLDTMKKSSTSIAFTPTQG